MAKLWRYSYTYRSPTTSGFSAIQRSRVHSYESLPKFLFHLKYILFLVALSQFDTNSPCNYINGAYGTISWTEKPPTQLLVGLYLQP